MRRLIANYFTSGALNLTIENRRRIILLNGILVVGFIALVAASLSAWFLRQNPALAAVDAVFALIDIGLITSLRLSKKIRLIGFLLTLMILALYFFLLVTGGDKNTGPLWFYLYPLFSFFLVGGRTAISLNVGLILVSGVLLFIPDLLLTTYDPAFRGRFLGSLAALTGITYIFERSRRDAEGRMLAAQKETDDIFHSIQEGLFLLNNVRGFYVIGSKYSAIVGKMLGVENPAGADFMRLLKQLNSKFDQGSTEKYLMLLFDAKFDETMLHSLNPLTEFEGERILAFSFHRITEENQKTHEKAIASIMVSIEDRTEAVKLARELKTREEKDSAQTTLILQILHASPHLLANFLEASIAYENEINERLKSGEHIDSEFMDEAYRKIHSIKGDARALGIEYVGARAHDAEDEISELRKMENPRGTDFLRLVMALAELKTAFENVQEMQKLIREHQKGAPQTSQTPIKDTLYNLVRQLTASTGKTVQLFTQSFDEATVPKSIVRPLQEILIQLVRNSFIHGIEDESEREGLGKKPGGSIRISAVTENERLSVRYGDDGRGLDVDKIKAHAIKAKLATASEIAGWSENRIYALIFARGLSTSVAITEDAGRGVGMDIVHENIRKLGGRIKLKTKMGRGTEFIFEFGSITI